MRLFTKFKFFGYLCIGILSLLFQVQRLAAQHNVRNIGLENGHLEVVFDKNDGSLISMRDIRRQVQMIDQSNQKNRSPFEIEIYSTDGVRILDNNTASEFKWTRSKGNAKELKLEWSKFKTINQPIKVTAYIALEQGAAMSSWKIAVEGIKGMKISNVAFPNIRNISDLGNEYLAVPEWMGSLLQSPRAFYAKNPKTTLSYAYPDHLAMQFIALYNPKKVGLFISCQDSSAYAKRFVLNFDENKNLAYKLDNIPEFVDTNTSYSPPYSTIIGTFSGDWQDAAKRYGDWGRKQWWARNSRLKNDKVAPWLKKTAYWVWNRGRSNNVLDPAEELSDRLNLPVNVLWHWWHGGSYDDSFPDYFPPRDGAEFIPAIDRAKKHQVNALLYMNQLKWGSSMPSWINEKAYLWSTKNIQGKEESHMYNIFTKKSLTYMCLATDFWKNKYAALVDSAVNKYHASGVYMDQACLSRVCYDTTHDHVPGGGNYWMEHFKRRDLLNRSMPKDAVNTAFAGEGGGECWLPYLDAFLTLGVSKERYAGVQGAETIPLFQAVYHDYGITFGNYSSLLTPPYDEMWPKENAPDNPETPLDTIYNGQFLIEQARSFVWGMQPMIANYKPFLQDIRAHEVGYMKKLAKVRDQSLKFLLQGRYLKNIELDVPKAEFNMSKLSIYAGQNEKVTRFTHSYPTVYHALWVSQEGALGISLASVQNKPFRLSVQLSASDYKLPQKGVIKLIGEAGTKQIGSYSNGKIIIDYMLEPFGIAVLEVSR